MGSAVEAMAHCEDEGIIFFQARGGANPLAAPPLLHDVMADAQGEPDDVDIEEERPLQHFNLKVVFDPRRNGLEETVNFPIDVGTVIAGRYRIVEYLGSGVFSRAVQCVDLRMGGMVCIKIIRNNKDFLDQSLGEIKLLQVTPCHRVRAPVAGSGRRLLGCSSPAARPRAPSMCTARLLRPLAAPK